MIDIQPPDLQIDATGGVCSCGAKCSHSVFVHDHRLIAFRNADASKTTRNLSDGPLVATLHPGVRALLVYFAFEHLPARLRSVSAPCADLAHEMAVILPSDPETTTGLRKLLEAKDCFVRAALPKPDVPR